MTRSLLLLAALVASAALAGPLAQPSGVLLHDNGGDFFRGGIAISNPDGAAPHTVSITPNLRADVGLFADSIAGHPLDGFRSAHASMSPAGRVAYQADWVRFDFAVAGPLIYVQDRDGTGRALLTDTAAVSRGDTPVGAISDVLPSVSPDGETVAFVSTRFRGRNLDGSPNTTERNLMVVPASGGAVTAITSSETIALGGRDFLCAGFSRVVWSPDGSRLAFIGTRPARDDAGDLTASGCVPSVGVMDADGSDVRVLRRGGLAAETPYTPSGLILDWTPGGILYHDSRQNTLEVMSPSGGTIRQIPVPSTIGGYPVRLDHGWALSPDGRYLATCETGGSVLLADLDLALVDRIETFTGGPRFVDWVDAPPTAPPARIALASVPALIWGGVQADLQPTLYDATGGVIAVGARSWGGSPGNVNSPRVNRLAGVLTGSATANQFDHEVCASNGGLTACVTLDNVHTPVVTVETDVSEITEGGPPATLTVRRYGHPRSLAVLHRLAGAAAPFRDVVLGGSPRALRFAEGQTEARLPLTALSDGVAEGVEPAVFRLVTDDAYVLGTPGSQSLTVRDDGVVSGTLGLSAVRPTRGEAGGRVTVRVAGRAFADGATLALAGGGTADPVEVVSPAELAGTLDLSGAAPGVYDVVVSVPGGAEARLAGAFTIDPPPAAPEVRLVAELTGPTVRIPSNIPRRFTVVVGNEGGADVHDVLGFVTVPLGVDVVVSGLLPSTLDGEPPWIEDEEAGDRMLPFWLDTVPAGQTVTMDLAVRAPLSLVGQGVPIRLVVYPPPADRPFTFSGDFADAPFELPYHLRGVAGIAVRLAEGGPGREAAARARGGEDPCDATVPFTTSDFETNVEHINEARLEAIRAARDLILGASGEIGLFFVTRFIALKTFLQRIALSVAGKEVKRELGGGFTDRARDVVTRNACPGVVNSYDPNDKLGPAGAGEGGHLRPGTPFAYTVRFENLDRATAPAQQVFVVDTLDAAVYDLDTFALGPVAFGDTVLTPPPGLRHWSTEVDLRPALPVVLLVHGGLDAPAGVARWTFSSIDPSTGGLPEDPGIGFLPPNVVPPEGEGSVSFTLALRDGLADGTEVRNRAEIVFDRNEPILTPTWLNTVDRKPPVSRATGATAGQDGSVEVTWEASDAGAGVQTTTLYVSADGGPFEPWGAGGTGTATFPGEPGVAYGVFALATDQAGNAEPVKTEAEATTSAVASETAPALPETVTLAAPYPNPVRAGAVVQFGLPGPGRADVRVFDVRGREVALVVEGAREAGWHRVPWDASVLAAGVYTVRLSAGEAVATRRLVVVR